MIWLPSYFVTFAFADLGGVKIFTFELEMMSLRLFFVIVVRQCNLNNVILLWVIMDGVKLMDDDLSNTALILFFLSCNII